jgi:helix-turn-helix protein
LGAELAGYQPKTPANVSVIVRDGGDTGGIHPLGDEALRKALEGLGRNIRDDAARPKSLAFNRAANFQAAKQEWLMRLARYPNLSGADYAVVIVIFTHLNSKKCEAWPSIATIAELTNRNPSTVWRSVEKLSQFGLLTIVKGRGRHRSNRYRPSLGKMNCDPKTLRRRNNNSASWQPKHCELAERTLEEP